MEMPSIMEWFLLFGAGLKLPNVDCVTKANFSTCPFGKNQVCACACVCVEEVGMVGCE